ncbi:PAS domain S-box protein, partial [Klebsiella pneumoniae]|nr:PAS domain S-box protein [Klebsiella pneumoniae]MCP6663832.1 PAS domain S-box protein [Klebsiella pneumoniae]
TSAATYFSDQESFNLLLKEINQQGAVKNREMMLNKKDGTVIWCSVTAIKHFDAKRELFWIDSVVEDITERKMAEKLL